MDTNSVIKNIDASMRDCLRYAKKARGKNAREYQKFIMLARRWRDLLTDHMSDQEAQAAYVRAWREVMG
jgi:hypothetical protein